MMKIGLIDYYLDQYHAEYYPKWLKEVSHGDIQVACAWAKIDKPDGKPNRLCCEAGGFPLRERMEDVIEECDGLIVMSPDNPEMHEELCALPLASGKPTYVDKTFAVGRAAAQRIIDHANRHHTPFFSTSALRYATEYMALEKDGLSHLCSRAPGAFSNYGIHSLEPIVCLMGPDIEKIMFAGTPTAPSFVLRFRDGRSAVMSQSVTWDFSIGANYTDKGPVEVTVHSDFYRNFLDVLTDFFRDGVPRVPAEETLQIMTILEYGAKAMETPDVWVSLPRL